ncbi:MAG: YihY/virulence factor BrkB family protein [Firmicutes bacterium]|nr:YihY/virulence factor BrkB family protein [Bacillota bacterium]
MKQVILKFIKRLRTDDLAGYAAQISFYLLVSMIPLMIMLTIVISNSRLMSADALMEMLRDSRLFPDQTIAQIEVMISGVTPSNRSLPIYLILLIWFASRGIRAIMNGIHMTFRTRNSFSIPKHFALSFLYTISFVLMTVLFEVLIVFGDKLFDFIAETYHIGILVSSIIKVIRYLVPLFFLFLLYTIMYKVIPGKELQIRDVLPGSIGATLGSYIVSQIFSYFVASSSAGYSNIYGGLASTAVICTWMWLFALVLILGSELNACVYEVKNNTTLISIY